MKDILDEIRYQYYIKTMLKSKICLMVGLIPLVVYCYNGNKSSLYIAGFVLALLLLFPLYFSLIEKKIRKNDIHDIARRVYKINADRCQKYILLKKVLSCYELVELKALRLKLRSNQGKGFSDSLNGSIGTSLACMALLVSLIPSNADPSDFFDFKVFILFFIFVVGVLYLISGFTNNSTDDYILYCIEEVIGSD